MFSNLDFDVIWRSLPYLFFEGMRFTLLLTALASAGGIVLGTLIAVMRLSSLPVLPWLAVGYSNMMRSLPLVLVIFLFYFLIPYVGQWAIGASRPIAVGAFNSVLVTFTLFDALYHLAPSIPQYAASAANADDCAVSGHIPGLRSFHDGFPRRGVEDRPT